MVISSRTAPPDASAAGDPEARDPAPGALGRSRSVPISLAVVGIPALIVVARLLLGAHRPFTNYGDDAILEAAVRRVASGAQTLGPYSRFGFHQPGPAYFFVQAPFSWLTGGSDRSLFLGAAVINFGAALGSVWLILRRYGERAARWTAAVVLAYVVAIGPGPVTNGWNPYVLGLPLLLGVLLAADAAAGSLAAAAAALVVGSYLVQTHVAVAVTLVAVGAVAAGVSGAFLVARRRDGAPHRRTAPPLIALGVAGALLALLWIPPLVEQATHPPGNLTRLAQFFSRKHPEYDAGVDHRLRTAATQVAAQLATLPLGRPPAGGDNPARRRLREGVALAELAVAGGVTAVGWRRRHAFVVTLGSVSLVGAATAVWSTTRIVGDVMPYLLVWSGVLLLPAWIGLGLLVPVPRPSSPRWRSALLAVPVGLILAWSMLRTPLPPVPDNPGVASAAGMVRPWLAAHGARSVRVRLGQHDQWPLAAGVINRLDDAGLAVSVDRQWTSLFGDQFEPSGHEPVEVWLTDPAAAAPVPGQQRLGVAAGAALWAGPLVDGGGP